MDKITTKKRKKSETPIVETDDRMNLALHERLTEKDLIKLQAIFKKVPDNKVTEEMLRKVLATQFNMHYSDEQMRIMFMKINTSRDNYSDWDEFVSYLLLGFQNDDPANQKERMQLPITGHPVLMANNHRLPVMRIRYSPTVMQDRTTSFLEGSYVTCSRDGTCNWWSLDMDVYRSGKSTRLEPRINPTWITDMVCLPDLNVLCTSSSERDLRFYNTTAKNFNIQIIINSFPHPICTMFYKFYEDMNIDNILILGDMGGNIKIIQFTPIMRGPFQNSPGNTCVVVRYDQLVKGDFPKMHCLEFNNVHTDSVRMIDIYEPLHSFISCADCSQSPFPPPGAVINDLNGVKDPYFFRMPLGVSVFTTDESAHLLITGGSDCIVRIWNVFVSSRPSNVLSGHHAGIIMLILQQEKLYSMSKDKVIKVWDLSTQALIQTSINLVSDMTDRCPICTYYNPVTRELIVGGMQIALLQLDPLLDQNNTDGFTHNKPVSVVLYNPLFKCVVSCGLDSCFIVWDPWSGKRLNLVKEAHTRLVHGETISVEITAATFDPNGQLLLTGARNGTLKVWNFNTGTCLRNMSIEDMCEVTSVFWVRGRMLAVGWNRHVTEFADCGTGISGKEWELRHAEDVLCAAVRAGQCLATSSYSGELIFWRLETGQAYRRFNVANPTGRIKLIYMPPEVGPTSKVSSKSSLKSKSRGKSAGSSTPSTAGTGLKIPTLATKVQETHASPVKANRGSIYKRGSIIGQDAAPAQMTMAGLTTGPGRKLFQRRISVVQMPTAAISALRALSIHAMVFLESRPMSANIGSLLVALENGSIQLWTHHTGSGFKASFNAIHTAGDYVSSMTTDSENNFLFTGTTAGYIKIWLMKNYGYFNTDPIKISKPRLRLTFPFLWRDRIDGRAKRSVRQQQLPVLLSCYRAHMRTIITIQYVEENKIVISGSSDNSVRLWTIGGRYLGTLGTFRPWDPIPSESIVPDNFNFRCPPDVRRQASFTTVKVFQGGEIDTTTPGIEDPEANRRDISAADYHRVYGKPLSDPLLGNFFKLPERGALKGRPVLDTSLPYIPVYAHLIVHEPKERERPPTPDTIVQSRILEEKCKKPEQN